MYWLFIFSYTIIVKGRSEPMISKKSELSELVKDKKPMLPMVNDAFFSLFKVN